MERGMRTRSPDPTPVRSSPLRPSTAIAVGVAIVTLLSACSSEPATESTSGVALQQPSPAGSAPPLAGALAGTEVRASGDADSAESDADWAIARETVEWALDQQLDLLPVGEVVAMIGSRFVGVPYGPGSLEIEGTERLVVNLSVFDCVTLVEHVLALSRVVLGPGAASLSSEEGFRDVYRDELTRLRYRGGVLDGYPSRLHYFSEWIADAGSKGILEPVTQAIGGVRDPRPIDFMSRNTEAYRQLVDDPSLVDAIRETEARLSETDRYVIPESEIAAVEGEIRTGDVIAAVSALDGLDIAHTGIAIRRGDRVHLLHAPLVGDSVEVSERPLAERILGFSSQTGIMVARPLEP